MIFWYRKRTEQYWVVHHEQGQNNWGWSSRPKPKKLQILLPPFFQKSCKALWIYTKATWMWFIDQRNSIFLSIPLLSVSNLYFPSVEYSPSILITLANDIEIIFTHYMIILALSHYLVTVWIVEWGRHFLYINLKQRGNILMMLLI